MKKVVDNIGLIILAAGASKRLGKPKQLLEFQGETLLRHAVKIAIASGCRPVIVVLGASAERLKKEITEFNVEIIENPIWENGMGTSIQIGIRTLLKKNPDAAGVILMTCDQPFVSADLLNRLADNFFAADKLIVACSYADTIGVPALLSRQLFSELIELKSDNGAKKIIFNHRENVIFIPFEQGLIDVDTEYDYLNLIKSERNIN